MMSKRQYLIVPLKIASRIFDRNHRFITVTILLLLGIWLLCGNTNDSSDSTSFIDTVFVNNPKFSFLHAAFQLPYLSNAELIVSNIYDTITFHLNSIIPPIRPIDKANKEPVKMIIVPHSHNDPGWMFTFTEYFDMMTNSILQNAANYLDTHENMRFIYAEICFVDLFFSRQNQQTRDMFKRQIKNGRLEIVTGGWVQPDEANSLLFALVMQLMEGHEWVRNHIGVIPKNHWSIDPFGHSPVMAYLVKLAGLKNGVLNRVHYELLKKFGETQTLEFDWRPSWKKSNEHDFRTHVMPYGHYDSARSCGPDFSVCCRLDFVRIGQSCIKEFGGQKIRKMEGEELVKIAHQLSEQVKLKSALYKHKSVFLQIGEDFRYITKNEWIDQEENFQVIFNYFDENPELGVKGQFGTLNDYFESLPKMDVPALGGDFFTYSDRDDHYWSGYFTSRPYFKQLDRTLQQFLRAADILFSLAAINGMRPNLSDSFPMLAQARRDMSLFQHHDGVTGTSTPHVMLDYEDRMLDGINYTKIVIAQAIESLSKLQNVHTIEASNRLKVTEETTIDGSNNLLIFNQLIHQIEEVICLKTSVPLKVTLISSPQIRVLQQINPVYSLKNGRLTQVYSKHELCFLARIGGLTLESYKLEETNDNSLHSPITRPKEKHFQLESRYITANFCSKTGLLQSIKRKDNDVEYKTQLQFVSYGSRPKGTKKTNGSDSVSGAYLFLPDKQATVLSPHIDELIIVKGPMQSFVYLHLKANYSLFQRVSLNQHEDAIRINNLIDLKKHEENIEFGMQLNADPQFNQFYTDLNGLELTRRKRYKSLPMHGQFYPMPSAALIQNDEYRLTLLSRQPHGVGSVLDGQLQVMLDRRLYQNDDRGELEPLVDNFPAESEFVLLIEPFHTTQKSDKNTIAYHSMKAHHYSLKMHNFPIIMKTTQQLTSNHHLSFLTESLPCDVHLLALRTSSAATNFDKTKELSIFPLNSTAMILQRFGVEPALGLPKDCAKTGGTLKPGTILKTTLKSITNVSLTMLYDYGNMQLNQEINLKPMDIATFRLDF